MTTSGKLSTMVAIAVVMMSCITPKPVKSIMLPGYTSCIQALLPCASYLNSTTPPKECCVPLKIAFETQLKCLCDALKNPTLTGSLGFDVALVAQTLPMYCNIDATGISDCSGAPKDVAPVAGSTSGATPPTGSLAPPPGTNAARSLSQVFGLIIVVASLMLY